MKIDQKTGLLDVARYVPSPNCDERPPGVSADVIIVHSISLPPGEFGSDWISQFFLNELDAGAHPYFATIADLKVSAHVLLRRDGHIVQYVPFHRRAWHAGKSQFEGRQACNDFAIGIELEGVDDVPYRSVQYARLASLVSALCDCYPKLTPQRVTGHSDVSPGRKTDPGPAFDWSRFRRLLRTEPRSLLV